MGMFVFDRRKDIYAQLLTTSKHNFALNNYLDIYVEKWAKPMPACRRYEQAIKKDSTMTMTSKLTKISGLKTQSNEKENSSLTISMLFDNFIAHRQQLQIKILSFIN